MSLSTLILEAAPLGGPMGIFAGIAFFLIFAAVAYIAFRLLKKTVKMAFRIAVVIIILLIAVAGSVSLYFFGSGSTRPQRPTPARTR